MIRKIARRILEGMRCTSEAADGRQALAACSFLPDAIFVDGAMPVLDGYEFLTELRAMPGGDRPKVVFCTSEYDVAQIARAMHAGADDFMMKPFDREHVQSKFAKASASADALRAAPDRSIAEIGRLVLALTVALPHLAFLDAPHGSRTASAGAADGRGPGKRPSGCGSARGAPPIPLGGEPLRPIGAGVVRRSWDPTRGAAVMNEGNAAGVVGSGAPGLARRDGSR